MTRQEMMDSVIRNWGFEHPATLYFFEVCERETDKDIIEVAYEFAMNWPNAE